MQGPGRVGARSVGTSHGGLILVLYAIDYLVGDAPVPVVRYNAVFAGSGTCCNGGVTHRGISDQVVIAGILAVCPCGGHLPESPIGEFIPVNRQVIVLHSRYRDCHN